MYKMWKALLLFIAWHTLVHCWHPDPVSLPKHQKDMLRRSLLGIAGAAVLGSRISVATTKECDICGEKGDILCRRCLVEANSNNGAEHTWYNPVNERIYDTMRKSYMPAHSEILTKELKDRRIVTIGEVHSNPCHHRLEFEVIKTIADNVGTENVAIGMECFYRQHQNALDRYIFEHNDIGKLKKETNWQETWGYDLNMYAKIFNFASINGVRLLGLNVPYPVVKLTAQVGYDDLPVKLRTLLPTLDMDNKRHREQFIKAIGADRDDGGMHASPDADKKKGLEHMYQAQVLWDEYMSETASNYIQENKSKYLIVIAGLGHILGRVGIPDRIEKRSKLQSFVIVPQQVQWSSEGLPVVTKPLTYRDCDWAWYTEEGI